MVVEATNVEQLEALELGHLAFLSRGLGSFAGWSGRARVARAFRAGASAREARRRGSFFQDPSLQILGFATDSICLVCCRHSEGFFTQSGSTYFREIRGAHSGSAPNRFPTPSGPGLRLLPSWLGRARHGPTNFEQEPAPRGRRPGPPGDRHFTDDFALFAAHQRGGRLASCGLSASGSGWWLRRRLPCQTSCHLSPACSVSWTTRRGSSWSSRRSGRSRWKPQDGELWGMCRPSLPMLWTASGGQGASV